MHMHLAVAATVALAVAAPRARAEPSRSFVVALTPAGAAPAWRADALTASLAHDLADDRLVFQPTALAACAPGCSDATLRGAGVELIVRGEVGADELRYRLVPLWAGAPAPVAGAIRFGAVDRAGLAAALRDRLHTIVRARADERAGADATLAPPDAIGVMVALAGAALVLALPFAIGAWRGRAHARAARIVRMPALRRTALGLGAVGAGGLAIAALGAPGPWFAAGGLAWGTLFVVAAPLVGPPLAGLGRVEHHELGRVLRAWLVIAALRTLVIAAVFALLAIATWWACGVLELDPALRGAVAVPLVALLAWHAWRCAIAVAALAEDDARVAATPDADAWHDAVRAYLIGYLRRAGLPVDAPLLAAVRFLPGAGDEVAVYGGGLTALRVVIPQALLEAALSPWGRPHDYAAPRVSTLHWTQWNAGLVVATEPGAPVATPAQRQPRAATVGVGVEGDGAVERELVGEPPTLAGIIEPAALDPRDSYRPHDDPMWLDWDPGLAYDGTDAGDRDFLFGLIVHAIGEMQRRDLLFGRLRGRAPAALGDLHAALGGARHHLVQYLGWRLWRRDDLLTARAYAPELEAASRRVLGVLAETSAGDPRLRRRLAALGALVVGAPPPRARWRRVALAGALAAGAGVAAIAIADAVRYHATYAERMRASSSTPAGASTPATTEEHGHGKEQ